MPSLNTDLSKCGSHYSKRIFLHLSFSDFSPLQIFRILQKTVKILNIFSFIFCSSQALVQTVQGYNVIERAAYCAVCQIHLTERK